MFAAAGFFIVARTLLVKERGTYCIIWIVDLDSNQMYYRCSD